jgi:hypothetical protein
MIKDIDIHDDLYVALAFMPLPTEQQEPPQWEAYIYNAKKTLLEHIIINVSACGVIDGIEKETGTMRFYIEKLEPESFKKFEILLHEALLLKNTYWISFYEGSAIGEKKLSVQLDANWSDDLSILPLIDKAGIFCV